MCDWIFETQTDTKSGKYRLSIGFCKKHQKVETRTWDKKTFLTVQLTPSEYRNEFDEKVVAAKIRAILQMVGKQ